MATIDFYSQMRRMIEQLQSDRSNYIKVAVDLHNYIIRFQRYGGILSDQEYNALIVLDNEINSRAFKLPKDN